jgi:hypothetical protein
MVFYIALMDSLKKPTPMWKLDDEDILAAKAVSSFHCFMLILKATSSSSSPTPDDALKRRPADLVRASFSLLSLTKSEARAWRSTAAD